VLARSTRRRGRGPVRRGVRRRRGSRTGTVPIRRSSDGAGGLQRVADGLGVEEYGGVLLRQRRREAPDDVGGLAVRSRRRLVVARRVAGTPQRDAVLPSQRRCAELIGPPDGGLELHEAVLEIAPRDEGLAEDRARHRRVLPT